MRLKYLKHVIIIFIASFAIFIPSMLLSFFIENDVINYLFVFSFFLVSTVVSAVVIIFILYWVGRLYSKFLNFQIRKDKERLDQYE